jgi:hypothetical protein
MSLRAPIGAKQSPRNDKSFYEAVIEFPDIDLHPCILFKCKDSNSTNFQYLTSSNNGANFHTRIIYIDFDTDSHYTDSNSHINSV